MRYPYRDSRPTPKPVLIAFTVFVIALLVIGSLMAIGSERILFWQPTKESTRVYGWFFIGASMYFAYGLVVRKWGNAAGQLLAFLTYDLVLVIPFLQAYRGVSPDFWLAHVIYTMVVIVSGVFAFYWCFLHRSTSLTTPPDARAA
jgi:peptidoglycan/LPS O-acetylase OafA/YrhL